MKAVLALVLSAVIFLNAAGEPGSLSLVWVRGAAVGVDLYRDDGQGGAYTLRHRGLLAGWRTFIRPVQTHIFSGVN